MYCHMFSRRESLGTTRECRFLLKGCHGVDGETSQLISLSARHIIRIGLKHLHIKENQSVLVTLCFLVFPSFHVDATSSASFSFGRGEVCSYTCTEDGVRSMITETGSYDRLAETIMEVSYGRTSFDWEPVIRKDVIELPIDTTTNLYAYHHQAAKKYIRDELKIQDIGKHFFQTMVMFARKSAGQ